MTMKLNFITSSAILQQGPRKF